MSADERILRLENALATLAEFGANQERRTARLEEAFARLEESSRHHEERLQRLEDGFRGLEDGFRGLAEGFRALAQVGVDQQRRTARLEDSYQSVVELLGRHDDRLDELRAAQAETERKMAALADSQVRLADSQERLADSHARLTESQARLADSQAHSDRRLDALIDIVRNWRDGKSET